VSSVRELGDEGKRVVVRTIRPTDVDAYRVAVLQSRSRLSRWNPVDPDDLLRHLARQSDVHRTFLLLARDGEGSHGVVGRVNVTNIVRGRFQSGVLGYDAFDPYVGRGLFAEGLGLVVGLALRPAARGGAGLHRVEANVQPGNVTSAGVLRSLGFRHEGRSPRMLLLAGPGDGERWRDHERYAVTAEEWPAPAYQRQQHRRLVVVVGGGAHDRRAGLAAALSTELGLPLLAGAADGSPDASAPALVGPLLWSVLGSCPAGAVVDVPWSAAAAADVRKGLDRAGADPADAVQVWCAADPAADPTDDPGRPSDCGLGRRITLDPATPLGPAQVTRIALQARAPRDLERDLEAAAE
jgi:ribosomal-protein-alanine N-acetyltransferase